MSMELKSLQPRQVHWSPNKPHSPSPKRASVEQPGWRCECVSYVVCTPLKPLWSWMAGGPEAALSNLGQPSPVFTQHLPREMWSRSSSPCSYSCCSQDHSERDSIHSPPASWNLGKTLYMEHIAEMQIYNKPKNGRLCSTAAIHWQLQCSGGAVKINRPGRRPGLPLGWTSSTGHPCGPWG